jgi:hypothetical protein
MLVYYWIPLIATLCCLLTCSSGLLVCAYEPTIPSFLSLHKANNKKRAESLTLKETTSPASTSNAYWGRYMYDALYSSVLSHPFIMSLLYELHGQKEEDLFSTFVLDAGIKNDDNLKAISDQFKQSNFSDDEHDILNDILKRSIVGNETETQITAKIKENINSLSDVNAFSKRVDNTKSNNSNLNVGKNDKYTNFLTFEAKKEDVIQGIEKEIPTRRMDLVLKDFTETSQSYTPLVVIEVGMKHSEWWRKFDQCTKCLEMLLTARNDTNVCFERPLLMVVATINNDATERSIGEGKNDNNVALKIAAFFCRPNRNRKQFQMTLLWHSRGDYDLFGKLLMVASRFQRMVNSDNEKQLNELIGYKYFGSNCCKIGNKVCKKI